MTREARVGAKGQRSSFFFCRSSRIWLKTRKHRTDGRNIVGCYTLRRSAHRLCMLFRVLESCFSKFWDNGCFPLCWTIRSETSGTNQGKMERHFSSKINFQPDRSVPFTLRFDRNFGYITMKWDWKREFLWMERHVSVGPDRAVKEDHLQRWSQIFRSDRTETDLSIWLQPEISGNFGLMESTQQLPTFLSFRDQRSVAQQCWIQSRSQRPSLPWTSGRVRGRLS